MLPYVDEGAADSLRRFGLERNQLGSRQHLQDIAEAELVKRIAKVAPDHLTQALSALARRAADEPASSALYEGTVAILE